ncbi:MAG TPA: transcription termination factor NusA [Longilinea sp.]|nr:transcription termination factor NusA [Longilinea sp.]
MKNEFTLAFNEILEEKGLPKEVILQALESAMISAYRRAVNASNNQHVEAQVDIETGKVVISAEKEVVESVQEPTTEVELEVARKYNPEAQLGDLVIVESTPTDFGRVAAQTARQVIQQRIRDAERQVQLGFFDKQVGEIISGVVQAKNAQGYTIGLEMKAEGNMMRKETIPGENFRLHERVRALVAEVKESPRGPQIMLSRTHRNFLRRLLENEVPEIYHGVVEIRSIAREPGARAKVAVSASQPGIDPVGACVGVRGVRIQTIVKELHDEKIDVIEWNNDPALFIAKAISPARVTGVYLNEASANGKTATVIVPEDQLSLAIGRDGQNARLAAKLTNWRIDIKSVPEAASEAINKLANDPNLVAIAEAEKDNVEKIADMLARKAEGKPLTPEEYDQIGRFVDRVEKKRMPKVEPVVVEEAEPQVVEIRDLVSPEIFNRSILDSGLAEHVASFLQEAGFTTVGELLVQIKRNPDEILKIQGISQKAMSEINKLADSLLAPVGEEPAAPVVEEPAAVEAAAPSETVETAVEEPAAVEAVVEEAAAEPVETAEEASFQDLFNMNVDTIRTTDSDEENESDDKSDDKKPGKKKKGKQVEIVYDPDRDITVAKKKHKRGTDGGWEWEE